jgi:hypothetical protein
MSFSIKARCQHGELVYRRKTSQAALKKARELARAGCYDVHIVTPEGRDYAASEFADLPRTHATPMSDRADVSGGRSKQPVTTREAGERLKPQ